MKTSAPTKAVWIVALVLGILGILARVGIVPVPYSFELVAAGFGLLALATSLKGL